MRINPILYRDESDKGGVPPTAVPAPATIPTTTSAPAPASLTLEDVTKALDTRLARAENSQARSMAEQYGMTEAEVKAMFEQAKAAKASKLPEDAQKQIDAAKAELQKYKLSAEVAKEGAVLGLLDADIAMTLLPVDATKANDKGEFAGLKSALEKLKTDKPYLFKSSDPAPTGQKKDVGGKVTTTTTETTLDKFKRMGYPARVELKKSNVTLYNTLTEQERTASADGKK